MARFWWGQVETSKKLHWISWSRMSQPLRVGGLDFKDFILFNQALLAKQCWMILNNLDLLLTRVLRAKYFDGGTLLEARAGSRPSHGFQSLLHGLQLLKVGLCWQVGSGFLLHPLSVNWVPARFPTVPTKHYPELYWGPPSVAGFVTGGRWDKEILEVHFTESSIAYILRITLPLTPLPDSLVWHFSTSGIYSTYRFSV
ncbi:Uncharacterized mitochondrial protein AtMg00310 [Linum perenne]